MAHHIKLNTPSGGRNEVLRAMVRRNVRGDRTRSVDEITRFLGPHYSVAAVTAVLELLESDGYAENPADTQWGLTDDGLVYIRQHPDSRFVAA